MQQVSVLVLIWLSHSYVDAMACSRARLNSDTDHPILIISNERPTLMIEWGLDESKLNLAADMTSTTLVGEETDCDYHQSLWCN